MYCAKCGAEQQSDARFCSGCGAQLAAAPTTPAAPPPAPPPTPVPVPAPVLPGAQPAGPPAKSGMPGWMIGCLIALLAALLLSGAAIVGYVVFSRAQAQKLADLNKPPDIVKVTPDTPAPEPPADADKPEPTPAPEPTPEPTPPPAPVVSSEDPVAQATVVLENYIAADLGHDGNEMKKYLGGQAAARFRPDVQGQEDVIVLSEKIASHVTKDSSTIVFKVTVKYSPGESPSTTKTSTDSYTLKKTEKGWLIFSTPAYP